MAFNILLSSISAKIPWIKAVKQAMEAVGLHGELIGADSSSALCIGSFFVDQFWQIPLLEHLSPAQLLEFCLKHTVKAIIPSRDGELAFFAQHKQFFQDQGIQLLISPPQAIRTCLDKQLFSTFLQQHRFPGIQTSRHIDEIEAEAYVVKERFGAGSKQAGIGLTKQAADQWARQLNDPLFQPFIKGKEYSIDLYIDKTGTTLGSVARSRDLVLRGESQISTTLKAPAMEQLCSDLAEQLGLYGHAVVQLIQDEARQLHIIECNPRFGGASTLSLAVGLNSFVWFILECLGHQLPPFIRSPEEKRQVRFPSDLILNHTDNPYSL